MAPAQIVPTALKPNFQSARPHLQRVAQTAPPPHLDQKTNNLATAGPTSLEPNPQPRPNKRPLSTVDWGKSPNAPTMPPKMAHKPPSAPKKRRRGRPSTGKETGEKMLAAIRRLPGKRCTTSTIAAALKIHKSTAWDRLVRLKKLSKLQISGWQRTD